MFTLYNVRYCFSHINESNCKLMSPEHYFFMTILQFHCITGLAAALEHCRYKFALFLSICIL